MIRSGILSGLIFSLFLLSCAQSAPNQTDTLKEAPAGDGATAEDKAKDFEQKETKKVILFFGNSLTAAYQLSPEQGYVALLQSRIDSLGLPYLCVNAGLSGETTADGVNRIEWVLQQNVDVFVLELGGNDALRGLPVKSSKQNLQAIIDKVLKKYPQCKIIIAGLQAPPNLSKNYATPFRKMYPELAKKNKAVLIPHLLENIGCIATLNLPDGIHPNIEGQKIMANNVWAVLQRTL